MFEFLKKRKINTSERVDELKSIVYTRVNHLGSKKHGRTLHRFVSNTPLYDTFDSIKRGYVII